MAAAQGSIGQSLLLVLIGIGMLFLIIEMIALVNQNRPASIQFIRATTTGTFSLEVEAQTNTAPVTASASSPIPIG